jgi:hypothetical protein
MLGGPLYMRDSASAAMSIAVRDALWCVRENVNMCSRSKSLPLLLRSPPDAKRRYPLHSPSLKDEYLSFGSSGSS